MSYKPVVGVPGPPNATAVNDDDSEALGTHSVTTTSPLTGGGTLASDPVIGETQATAGTDGYVTAAKYTSWDAKMTNPMTAFGDIIYGGAGAPPAPTPLPVGATNTVLHGATLGTPSYSKVVEDDLALANVGTANADVTKHGFAPKLSGVITQFLAGDGSWQIPAGAGTAPSGYGTQAYNFGGGGGSINVIHNLHNYPIVQCVSSAGVVVAPGSITHNTVDDFTVAFPGVAVGTIIYSIGAPQVQNVVTTAVNYVATNLNHIIQVTVPGKTVTLQPVATAGVGREVVVDNASGGEITVFPDGAELIEGEVSQPMPADGAIRMYCTGTGWRIY